MRHNHTFWIAAFTLLLFSCRKDHPGDHGTSPPPPVKKILLKDITIPHLPSPYYHFEYNSDSMAAKVDFASGFSIYDVVYNGNKIKEMRNNIIVNHDTLRYIYDNSGKIGLIIFINDENVIYRHVNFLYDGDLVREIDWDHKEGNVGYLIDRTLKFTYHPDGNVKMITEHRPAISGSPEFTSTLEFDQYDDKINVDDFSLIHDTFHDHLFLLQGFRIQKNNPLKEVFSAGPGQTAYKIDYTYTYNSDKTPSLKAGDFIYTSGSDSGKRSQISTAYAYY